MSRLLEMERKGALAHIAANPGATIVDVSDALGVDYLRAAYVVSGLLGQLRTEQKGRNTKRRHYLKEKAN